MVGGVRAAAVGEDVLGISISDPEILKATQFLIASISVNAFFLLIDLVNVIEQQGLHGLDHVQVIFWAFDTPIAAFMIISGYVGVKRSNEMLLGTFCILSVMAVVTSLAQAVHDISANLRIGEVLLQVFAALFFAAGGHFARFLRDKARLGSLQDGAGDQDSRSYALLGIQLWDLQILKATQRILTSLGIIVCIFGSICVLVIEDVTSHPVVLGAWLTCVSFIVLMGYSGYYGIKRSNVRLLRVFSCCSSCCGCLFLSVSVMLVLMCVTKIEACAWSAVVFYVGVTVVFCHARHNSQDLMDRAASGVDLTAPIPDSQVAADQIGESGLEPSSADLEQDRPLKSIELSDQSRLSDTF